MGLFVWAVVAAVSALAFRYRKQMFGFATRGSTVPQEFQPVASSVRGKKYLIVGGTKGLGLALAKLLKKNGASVVVVGRSAPTAAGLEFVEADLQTVKQQLAFANKFDISGLDVVVLTTGILAPPKRVDNGEGMELDLAISYISRKVILDRFRERGLKARVFAMGFPGQDLEIKDWNAQSGYSVLDQHMNTVVANEALVLAYRRKFPELEVYGLNPGLVQTDIRSNMYAGFWRYLEPVLEGIISLVFPSADEYAQHIYPVIAAERLPRRTVSFNSQGEALRVNPKLTEEAVERIWRDSEALVARALGKQ